MNGNDLAELLNSVDLVHFVHIRYRADPRAKVVFDSSLAATPHLSSHYCSKVELKPIHGSLDPANLQSRLRSVSEFDEKTVAVGGAQVDEAVGEGYDHVAVEIQHRGDVADGQFPE